MHLRKPRFRYSRPCLTDVLAVCGTSVHARVTGGLALLLQKTHAVKRTCLRLKQSHHENYISETPPIFIHSTLEKYLRPAQPTSSSRQWPIIRHITIQQCHRRARTAKTLTTISQTMTMWQERRRRRQRDEKSTMHVSIVVAVI